jgi:peptidoglycan/LPS O-acetylase OafA/YrhL
MLNCFRIPEVNEINRNFGLDLVRAVAIILVLLSHGRFLLPEFPGKILLANGGFFGVELFFVLSGFLIGTILIKEFDGQQEIGIRLVRDFWIRRWFRTIPNYLLFLVLNLTLFQWLFVQQPFDLRYLFFLQNFMWPCPLLMPESWSLAVEEWFYFSLPLMMLAFAFLPLRKKYSLLICFALYILMFSIIRFYGAMSGSPAWDEEVRKVVVYRLDAIGYGVLAAYFNYYHGAVFSKHRATLAILGAICLGFSVVVFTNSLLTTMETFFNRTWLFVATSLGFALMLPWFKDMRSPNRNLVEWVSHISITSYSMYLIHFSFAIPLLKNYMPTGLPWLLVYLLYLALTTILSTVVYKFYEKPMTRLREKFTARDKTFLTSPAKGMA